MRSFRYNSWKYMLVMFLLIALSVDGDGNTGLQGETDVNDNPSFKSAAPEEELIPEPNNFE